MSMSLGEICSDLLSRYTARQWLDLTFDGFRVRVRSNAEALIGELGKVYAGYVDTHHGEFVTIVAIEGPAPEPPCALRPQPPSPGKTRIKEAFLDLPDGRIATRIGTGMMFLFGQGRHVVVGPCLAQQNRVVDFINSRYCQWRVANGAVLFHVAGLELDGRGVALAGFPGRGKSTLALHLMNHGGRFVTNDRALVCRNQNDVIMHGVPKAPRVNPGTLLTNQSLAHMLAAKNRAEYEALPMAQLWEVESKYDVDVTRCFGQGRQLQHCSLDALVILNWRPASGIARISEIDLHNRNDLWSTFTKRLGLFCDPDPKRNTFTEDMDRYLSLLDIGRAFEITGGVDFEAAVDACMNL